jgi:hypothetical protein
MITKHKELHKYLNLADFSKFRVDKKYKIEIHENVRKYSRFLGTEFDRTIKNILSQINSIETADLMHIWIKSDLFHPKNKLLPVEFSNGYNTKYDKSFSINKFLENYDFKKSFSYGIKNEIDKKTCQDYLTNLFLKVDLEKFKAKKILITDLKIEHRIKGGVGNSGYIDLIIDDKIIDIKTDIEINKIPNSYISQLLYYYIFIKYIIASNKKNGKNEYFKKLTINKVCLYYANFDLLIEFDVKKIFSDEKQFMKLMNNELIFGNNRIREITDNAILSKKFDNDYFKSIESKIIQNRQKIFKHHLENLIILNDVEKANLVLSELRSEFPKCSLTVIFSVFLNFLQNQYSLDESLISKNHLVLKEYIENTKNECERILKYETENLSKYSNEYHHILNTETFKTSNIKSKSYNQFLNNLNHFKLYVDFYTNISKP